MVVSVVCVKPSVMHGAVFMVLIRVLLWSAVVVAVRVVSYSFTRLSARLSTPVSVFLITCLALADLHLPDSQTLFCP